MDTISKMPELHFGPGSGLIGIFELTWSTIGVQETSVHELDERRSAVPQGSSDEDYLVDMVSFLRLWTFVM